MKAEGYPPRKKRARTVGKRRSWPERRKKEREGEAGPPSPRKSRGEARGKVREKERQREEEIDGRERGRV